MSTRSLLGALIAIAASPAQVGAQPEPSAVVPNDNRVAGGRLIDGVLELHIVADRASWWVDDRLGAVPVQAFSEAGRPPQIPGPLLRVEQGAEVHVVVENRVPDSTLIVRGLSAGALEVDSLMVPPGGRRDLRFRAGTPGTYLYWGSTTNQQSVDEHRLPWGHYDGHLRGAVVVDPAGVAPDPDERIFVMSVLDILPDTTRPPPVPDYWARAINGQSWPHTERLDYEVGRPVRWRWINGTHIPHPMHLHGFHFRVTAKGDGLRDHQFVDEEVRDVVTELMAPASTFAMEWTPTREGNWLFHCHMMPHITPFPDRTPEERGHDVHDVGRHAIDGMAGLVLGIRTHSGGIAPAALPGTPANHLRLMALQGAAAEPPARQQSGYATGFIVPDAITTPGPTLLMTRGETTAVTVVNLGEQPTSVHWHGMELESIYDGVAGWSGARGNMAPLIAPGDSFTVAFTPPRAGTFMYHSHMDEAGEVAAGSYGALLVMQPGQTFDPETDLLFMAGSSVHVRSEATINGSDAPPDRTLRVGTTYRIRLMSVLPAEVLRVSLSADSTTLSWRAVAKDGADLPSGLQVDIPADFRLGTGETYDFIWTPARPMEAALTFQPPFGQPAIRQLFVVR